MTRITTILGARPQFIKAAAVSRAILANPGLEERIIHTGQHYDYGMSDIFFEQLDIPKPQHNLAIGSGPHGAQTGEMLKAIEQVLIRERPDVVLVYGDTNSTLAGALAAAKLNISVAHVEAGLRSFNRGMPEEINRVLTDHVSRWCFAPTTTAVDNLKVEGITGEKVLLTGDVMYDALLYYSAKTAQVKNPATGPFLLTTIHRQENTDDPARLRSIFEELDKLSGDFEIVMPVHPRTVRFLDGLGWKRTSPKFHMIEPVGYLEMIALQKACGLILTDSGGLQKEAYLMGKHCLTLRRETEWVELVRHGYNDIVVDLSSLAGLVRKNFNRKIDPMKHAFYGNGKSADAIASFLAGVSATSS